MKHPVSFDEWLAYADGDLDAEGCARVREHVTRCGECRSLCEDLVAATAGLRESAHEFVAAHPVDAAAVRRGRDRVLARIRVEEPAGAAFESVAGGELSVGRLRRLQRVVAPVCGAHTAFRLIVAAVGRTSGRARNWENFLSQLVELTSAVCGRSVARLVLQIGSSLP